MSGEKMIFLNFGYYIVEPASIPKHLKLKSKQILTATDCICNLHPSLTGSFWINHEKEQPEYQKALGLSDAEFVELKETVSRLFDEHKLDFDSRFLKYSDALSFLKKYLYNLPDLNIISVALEDAFKDVFIKEAGENLNAGLLKEQKLDGDLLGYDILGWSGCGFHSYLCNNLNEDISGKYSLDISDCGLIQNQYSQVKEFAEYIKDKGEPVIWFPFAVYIHALK